MESIGDKLETTREGKDYTIEQIARDTNIAKRYLIALEQESFKDFPGEPYLLGFRGIMPSTSVLIRRIVTLYKNMQIQEQPVPIDELLEKRNPRAVILIIAFVLVVGSLITLVSSLYQSFSIGRPKPRIRRNSGGADRSRCRKNTGR